MISSEGPKLLAGSHARWIFHIVLWRAGQMLVWIEKAERGLERATQR